VAGQAEASRYAQQFVLKGGMLLAAFQARRPTADADALGRGFANDQASVLDRVVAIANQPISEQDGVEFRTETVTSRVIPDAELYSGVRIAMDTAIASALVRLRLDVNFGDPVTPAPQRIELPALRARTIRRCGCWATRWGQCSPVLIVWPVARAHCGARHLAFVLAQWR
jgi:hypothetical protein